MLPLKNKRHLKCSDDGTFDGTGADKDRDGVMAEVWIKYG